jgi:hypothetical protein
LRGVERSSDVDLVIGPHDQRAAEQVTSRAILMDLFPAHVAEALMRGEKVPPERKEAVTMYFSGAQNCMRCSRRECQDPHMVVLLKCACSNFKLCRIRCITYIYICRLYVRPIYMQVYALPEPGPFGFAATTVDCHGRDRRRSRARADPHRYWVNFVLT